MHKEWKGQQGEEEKEGKREQGKFRRGKERKGQKKESRTEERRGEREIRASQRRKSHGYDREKVKAPG